jgi:molybdopterin-guanine dinucleotide biosynthesis protein A
MQAASTSLLLTLPCDSPFLPAHLVDTLYRAMTATGAEIIVAHDGERMQQVYALLRCVLLPDLLDYLDNDGRSVDTRYAQHRMALADLSASPEVFLNLNTPEDKQIIEAMLAAARTIT